MIENILHPSGLSSVKLISLGERTPSAFATAFVKIFETRSFSANVNRYSPRFKMSISIEVKIVSNSGKKTI
jgi:hypothetical protein